MRLVDITDSMQFIQWELAHGSKFSAKRHIWPLVEISQCNAQLIKYWILANKAWLKEHITAVCLGTFRLEFNIAGYYWYFTASHIGSEKFSMLINTWSDIIHYHKEL